MCEWLKQIVENSTRFVVAFESIAKDIKRLTDKAVNSPPPKPGRMKVRLDSEGEEGMATFTVLLPAIDTSDPHQKDILEKHVTLTGPDSVVQERTVGRDEVEITGFTGPLGDYQAELHYHDDAGNTSVSRNQTLTVADTTAPPQPGEMGVRLDSEE